eukprot:CAMPEP_0172751048 /NCGR_PEP_ID=MMETSP1074-20121228/150782_1 /TAXON_ID=2916 /ORGANISM="Ceratium fusus, Strain PA161109" /LENGTH=30 /DNA_ID= /DNA_START= /DNA_END= /DNA_ORIENTATION=
MNWSGFDANASEVLVNIADRSLCIGENNGL